MDNNLLKNTKQAIDRVIQTSAAQKADADKRNLILAINAGIGPILVPYLQALVDNSKVNRTDLQNSINSALNELRTGIADALRGLKLDSITHDIKLPDIRVPDIQLPQIVIDTQRIEEAITKAVIGLKINIPEIQAPSVNMPDFMKVVMDRVDSRNPLPVQMMGSDGKPFNFPMPLGQGGGKSNFLTIKNLLTSGGATMVDETNTALRVSLVSGSLTLGYDTNIGPSGANTLRVAMATDSVTSVNIVSGSSAGTEYVDQSTINTPSGGVMMAQDSNNSIFAVRTGQGPGDGRTLRVVHATDAVVSTNLINQAQGAGEANANSLRVIVATDSVESTNLVSSFEDHNSGPVSANTLRVAQAVDVGVSTNLIGLNGNTPDTNAGPAGVGTLRVAVAVDSVQSTNLVSSYEDHGTGPVSTNTLRVSQAVDVGVSTNMLSSFEDHDRGVATSTTLKVVHAVDVGLSTNTQGDVASGASDSGNPVKVGGVARTTQPTAVSDAQRVNFGADKLGRQLNRPVQVRELISTAYASLTTGTEATLLAGVAGSFLDLIYIMLSNQSTAAVQVDVRCVTAGNIVKTYQVPANGTVGESLSVPWPQDATGNNWTVDMPDITGTTVNISAMFSKES